MALTRPQHSGGTALNGVKSGRIVAAECLSPTPDRLRAHHCGRGYVSRLRSASKILKGRKIAERRKKGTNQTRAPPPQTLKKNHPASVTTLFFAPHTFVFLDSVGRTGTASLCYIAGFILHLVSAVHISHLSSSFVCVSSLVCLTIDPRQGCDSPRHSRHLIQHRQHKESRNRPSTCLPLRRKRDSQRRPPRARRARRTMSLSLMPTATSSSTMRLPRQATRWTK